MAGYSIFLYDWFHENGSDLYPAQTFTKKEAEEKLFERYPDSKLELIEEETCKVVPKGRIANAKEIIKNDYYLVYPNDLVEGAFLKIEKKRKKNVI